MDDVTATTEQIKSLALYPPPEESFAGTDFLPSGPLTELAMDLVRRFEHLGFIAENGFTLEVVWKRKGGARNGKATLGKCAHPSGLLAFYSRKDWVIWVAADHARAMELNARQIEAVVYHELNHCGMEKDPEGEEPPRATVVGHDIEAFCREIQDYGFWRPEMEIAGQVVARQMRLGEDAEIASLAQEVHEGAINGGEAS